MMAAAPPLGWRLLWGDRDGAGAGPRVDRRARGVGGGIDRGDRARALVADVGGFPVGGDRDVGGPLADWDGRAGGAGGGGDGDHGAAVVAGDVGGHAVRGDRDDLGGAAGRDRVDRLADLDGRAWRVGGDPDRGDRARARVADVGGLPVGGDRDVGGPLADWDGRAGGAGGGADGGVDRGHHLVAADGGDGHVGGLSVRGDRDGSREGSRASQADRRAGLAGGGADRDGRASLIGQDVGRPAVRSDRDARQPVSHREPWACGEGGGIDRDHVRLVVVAGNGVGGLAV